MSLLRTAARVKVATSVHGKVSRRQQNQWAAQDAAAAAAATPTAAPQEAAAPPAASSPATDPTPAQETTASSTNQMLAQLTQLGELRTAGVLTDAEFEQQKARILGS